ncbi:MAG TPA: PD-(D/E)XK nuclease family protein, partial [Thermoanaerobaculia bacterium]|nr:PD-(D/E)XK nuclease family protein [Thermoanaerobaculia bacterium]
MAQQLGLFDVPVPPPSPPGRVLVARGALAAEALLLERIGALVEEARREPRLLALPVRIVVPSRSLRAHLGAAIVRARGRSVAGVTVQTLYGLAREILERAGEVPLAGEPLFGVIAQRRAREEAVLRRGLDGLVDGFGAVVGTVRDLIDAGFEPEHADGVDEALATDGPGLASRAEVERARALVRVAAGTVERMQDLRLGFRAALLRRALELLDADPERTLPSRAVLVHGFADAIGVATDLLEGLLRRRSAWLVLDRPAEPLGDGVEKAFTERFTGRLVLAVGTLEPAAPRQVQSPPVVKSFEALGGEAEAREVARRVRDLLDGGARPEGIGLVARDLGPYRLPLRRHLGRLGVPFSGVGERGSLEPAGRRARAFLELLRRGEDVPADRWLDAVASFPSGNRERALTGSLLVDLRLGFASLGAARLRDVAALPVETVLQGDSYPLPIRQGLRSAGPEEDSDAEGDGHGEAHTYANRRRVAGFQIRRAVRSADRLCRRLSSWPEEAPAGVHLHKVGRLLVGSLGWRREDDSVRPVFAALEELDRELPPDFPLHRDELRLLLERLLDGAGASALGGQGGGVQVLSVIEARSRTFDHAFVLGLNRDVFPRGIREDPLLPDDLRLVLQRVLPDVPVKRSGFDEERYLFAQLLSASPAVTLSWQAADDDGRPLSPSPLVERLRERIGPVKAPALHALPAAGPLPGLRPADEHAILAGLHAPRRWFGRVLPLALEEVRAGLAGSLPLAAADLAASRLAVLDEMDPDLRTPEGRAVRSRLGPYFGFIGRPRGERGDPRLRPLYVTHLENLAACPWQLFLGRLLRIEPTPDPLAALPGIDPPLLGNVVHAALARLSRERTPRSASGLPEPLEAVAVSWPPPEKLDWMVLEEAGRLLADEGIVLPG